MSRVEPMGMGAELKCDGIPGRERESGPHGIDSDGGMYCRWESWIAAYCGSRRGRVRGWIGWWILRGSGKGEDIVDMKSGTVA